MDPTAELGRKAAIRPLSANRLAPEDACPEPPGPPTGRHAHDADHIPNGDTADGPGAPERWNDVDGVLDFTGEEHLAQASHISTNRSWHAKPGTYVCLQTTPAAPSTAMTSGCPAPGTGGTRQDLRGPRRRRRRSDQQLGMRAIHGAQFLGPPIAPRKVSGAHTLPDSIGTRPGRHPRRGRRCPPRRGETQCRQRPNASTRSSCSCVGACRAWPHARPSACPWTLVGARCRERPSTRASRRWPALAPGHLARHCLSGVPGAPRTTRTLRLARAALLG